MEVEVHSFPGKKKKKIPPDLALVVLMPLTDIWA